MRTCWLGLVVCAGCSTDHAVGSDATVDVLRSDTAVVDTIPPRCDVTKPFGAPTPLASVNTAGEEVGAWLSRDGLRLYFTRSTSGDPYMRDIYVATRPSLTDAFMPATPIAELNTTAIEQDPKLTADELTIFFIRGLPGDILVATRADIDSPFATPQVVPALSSTDYESAPWTTADGLTLYFCSSRSSGGNNFDLFRTARTSPSASFSAPMPLTELLTAAVEATPALRDDSLEIFFATNRDGVPTPSGVPNNIWRAVRPTLAAPFDAPAVVGELSEPVANDGVSWLSADGCELILSSDRAGGAGGYDVWFASRP
jgi:hypothetical protein